MEQSILASDLRVIVRLMTARQLNTEAMLSAAGIDAALLTDPRARVSAASLGHVITQLFRRCQEPTWVWIWRAFTGSPTPMYWALPLSPPRRVSKHCVA